MGTMSCRMIQIWVCAFISRLAAKLALPNMKHENGPRGSRASGSTWGVSDCLQSWPRPAGAAIKVNEGAETVKGSFFNPARPTVTIATANPKRLVIVRCGYGFYAKSSVSLEP